MKEIDEPVFTDIRKEEAKKEDMDDKNLNYSDRIMNGISSLCSSQSFGVLSTVSSDQPYSNLISFATTEDLSKIIFATSIHTRKFNLLKENSKVSLLVDNRSTQADSINRISSVTAVGSVDIPTDKNEIDKWSKLLSDKHHYLTRFIHAPSNVIVVIDVSRYFYVRRFQEVVEWSPHQNF